MMDSRPARKANVNRPDEVAIGPDVSELKNPGSQLSSTASISRLTKGSEFKAVPAVKKAVNAYTIATKKFIDDLEKDPNNLDALKNLSPIALRECRDSVNHQIAKVPVLLNSRVYDLLTLLALPEDGGFRKDPKSSELFSLSDIQPAYLVQTKIQEKIKEQIKEQEQEEKYSTQAAVFIASAERARREQRSKCVIL